MNNVEFDTLIENNIEELNSLEYDYRKVIRSLTNNCWNVLFIKISQTMFNNDINYNNYLLKYIQEKCLSNIENHKNINSIVYIIDTKNGIKIKGEKNICEYLEKHKFKLQFNWQQNIPQISENPNPIIKY